MSTIAKYNLVTIYAEFETIDYISLQENIC